MNPVRRFFNQPVRERSLLLQAGTLVVLIRVALWMVPFRQVRRLSQRLARGHWLHVTPRSATVGQIALAVRVASRYMADATCLTQALVTQILLSQYGYSGTLRIGVGRHDAGRFVAHAWIEHDGRVVIGQLPDLHSYTPLPSLEGVSL